MDYWLESYDSYQSLKVFEIGLHINMQVGAAASSPLSFMDIGDCLKGTQLLMDNVADADRHGLLADQKMDRAPDLIARVDASDFLLNAPNKAEGAINAWDIDGFAQPVLPHR